MPRFAILTRLFRISRQAVAQRAVLRGTIFALAVLSLVSGSSLSFAQVIMMRSSPQGKKKPLDMVLRSIAVVEWTGPAGHPAASRLIPIAVYTNDEFLDGGAYLAQPVPLAVQKGTEYVLQTSGVSQGTYDIDAARKLGEIWLGIGTWTPQQTAPATTMGAKDKPSDASRPVLHLRSPDPDRPRMAYGQADSGEQATLLDAQQILHSATRQQIVAISDSSNAKSRALAFQWKSAADEQKMQAKIEAVAETDLKDSIPAPNAPNHPASATKKLALTSIDFRCFALHAELKASEEIPTCIFSAENPQSPGPVRYITVIARPDIYGTPHALSYAIAEDGKLDTHPRARLVDAVSATGTRDADLLIELDGEADRRFGLYRVNGDQVKLVYITGKLQF